MALTIKSTPSGDLFINDYIEEVSRPIHLRDLGEILEMKREFESLDDLNNNMLWLSVTEEPRFIIDGYTFTIGGLTRLIENSPEGIFIHEEWGTNRRRPISYYVGLDETSSTWNIVEYFNTLYDEQEFSLLNQ